MLKGIVSKHSVHRISLFRRSSTIWAVTQSYSRRIAEINGRLRIALGSYQLRFLITSFNVTLFVRLERLRTHLSAQALIYQALGQAVRHGQERGGPQRAHAVRC